MYYRSAFISVSEIQILTREKKPLCTKFLNKREDFYANILHKLPFPVNILSLFQSNAKITYFELTNMRSVSINFAI
jgi:hypothetical protein